MKTRNLIVCTLMMALTTSACSAGEKKETANSESNLSVKEQLNGAKEKKQTVFLVVTDSVTPADSLNAIVNEVLSNTKNTMSIQMNVNDKANSDLIAEYRLNGAPMPLLLLISDRGLLLGGMLADRVTKQVLTDAIPTPKYSEITYAISKGNSVLALVSNEKFKSNQSALSLCASAKKLLNEKGEVIVIDADDSKESKLIEMLNIKSKPLDSYIVTINSQGIMSGRFETLPTVDELVGAAQKVVQTGCAPGGCGSTCK